MFSHHARWGESTSTHVAEAPPFALPFLVGALKDLDKLPEILLVLANGLTDFLQLRLQLLCLLALRQRQIGSVRIELETVLLVPLLCLLHQHTEHSGSNASNPPS